MGDYLFVVITDFVFVLVTLVWWIGLFKSEETRHIGNLTIYAFAASQRVCGGHSGINAPPTLIPPVISGDDVSTAGRSFHPLHSQNLEVVSEKPCSVGESADIPEGRVLS